MRLRLLAPLALLLLWFLATAATAASAQVAAAATGFLILVLLPIALKFVNLDGKKMAALAYAASLAIGLLAGWVSGELRFDFSSTASTLAFATTVYGLQQLAFQLLKDSPKIGPLIK